MAETISKREYPSNESRRDFKNVKEIHQGSVRRLNKAELKAKVTFQSFKTVGEFEITC